MANAGVTKEELSFLSRDGMTHLHAQRWIPDRDPIAIIQIVHGMQEYIDRYDEFATFLAQHGYVVCGEDHLGHGGSVREGDTYGYFCRNDAATVLVRDVHRLKKMTQEKFPGIPVIIIGHSFGSYILRKYLTMYGSGIDGAIVQGTGIQSDLQIRMAKIMGSIIQLFHGPLYRSNFINKIAFGTYLKNIPDAKSEHDWLSHNRESIEAYDRNPACNFIFTMNGFMTLGSLIQETQSMSKMQKIPKDLPILLTSGKEDPVGNWGKSVEQLYAIYQNKLGLKNVELKMYDGFRHELDQEIGREQVYADQLEWIEKVLAGGKH